MPQKGKKSPGSGIYIRTEEHKKKISDSMKGVMPKFIPNNKGRVVSEETKRKMSEVHKGKRASVETKIKRSESLKKTYRTGGHPNWKGGINPVNDTIRKSLEYKLWHKACLERDDFTCQKTGQRGGKLRVHHINNFADFPELRFAIDNGITLSLEAHKEFHKKYGFKNNTREQLEEFLTRNKLNS